MTASDDSGLPKLPRGAGSISFSKGAWEGRWLEGKRRQYFRHRDYMTVYAELLNRWKLRQQGMYVAPAEMTIRDLVSAYIDRRVAYNKWTPATTHLYERTARLHIYPTIGSLRVLSVDPPRLQHWIDQLARTLTPNSINVCTSLLSAAYNQAVRLGMVAENPCRHIEHPEPLTTKHVTWTVEQIGRVDAVLRDEPRWLAVYRLILSTGMRPGELRALVWQDIDFANRRVRIARTITEDRSGHLTVGARTKSGRTRYVPLTNGPRVALLAWQAELVRRSLDPATDWVFPGTHGQPMSRGMWASRHERLIVEAKVPRITLHGLRHSSATLEIEAGTPTKIVAERLGHKDPGFTTRVYQHISTAMQDAAADALDERLFGSGNG